MQKLLNVYKPKGMTPLQTITLLREKFPEYENETIGFAGRLDPLAHGVLLLMVGEETTKEKDTYLNLPKEYEFETVFGVSTDTYDALGIVTNKPMKQSNNDLQSFKTQIEEFIKKKLGKQIQQYPPYSSKTVNGKPLYLWAREDKLSEIEIPKREIEIYHFKLIETNTITAKQLKNEIWKQIDSVSGDFRQEEIKNSWNTFFTANSEPKTVNHFITARFRIACSSGTYVRSLVNELGEYLGTGAIAREILRTRTGSYILTESRNLTK